MPNRKQIQAYFLFLVLFAPAISNATGPSYADVIIRPVAATEKGVLLFKTYSHINKSGRHSLDGSEYGWLVVSAQGVWEERIYYRVTEKDSEDSKKIDSLEREFNGKIDLRNPPKSAQELMDKYTTGKWVLLDPNKGKDEVNWYPGKVCIESRCTKRYFSQRSLNGLTSHEGSGTRVGSSFFYRGVALFNNSDGMESEKPTGASFLIRNLIDGQDVGVDMKNIAGIVLLNE